MADRKRKRQEYREERRGKGRPVAGRTGAPARPVWPIQRGWKVYTADKATLGSVGDVPEGEDFFPVSGGFLLRRYTVYVPTRFVRAAGDGHINLRVTKSQALRWRQPPVARRPAAASTEEADVATAPPAPLRSAADKPRSAVAVPAGGRTRRATPIPRSAVAAPSAAQPAEQGQQEVAAVSPPAQDSQGPVAPSPETGAVGSGSDAAADEIREAALHRFAERLEALARSESEDVAAAPARGTSKSDG